MALIWILLLLFLIVIIYASIMWRIGIHFHLSAFVRNHTIAAEKIQTQNINCFRRKYAHNAFTDPTARWRVQSKFRCLPSNKSICRLRPCRAQSNNNNNCFASVDCNCINCIHNNGVRLACALVQFHSRRRKWNGCVERQESCIAMPRYQLGIYLYAIYVHCILYTLATDFNFVPCLWCVPLCNYTASRHVINHRMYIGCGNVAHQPSDMHRMHNCALPVYTSSTVCVCVWRFTQISVGFIFVQWILYIFYQYFMCRLNGNSHLKRQTRWEWTKKKRTQKMCLHCINCHSRIRMFAQSQR